VYAPRQQSHLHPQRLPKRFSLGSVDTMAPTVRSLHMSTSAGQIRAWGDGLALRLTKPMAKTAGVTEGTPVRITVRPGRIVIQAELEPTLEQMLAAFDPKRHGGELMAGRAAGAEAFG
jgi:antitoxin MazE